LSLRPVLAAGNRSDPAPRTPATVAVDAIGSQAGRVGSAVRAGWPWRPRIARARRCCSTSRCAQHHARLDGPGWASGGFTLSGAEIRAAERAAPTCRSDRPTSAGGTHALPAATHQKVVLRGGLVGDGHLLLLAQSRPAGVASAPVPMLTPSSAAWPNPGCRRAARVERGPRGPRASPTRPCDARGPDVHSLAAPRSTMRPLHRPVMMGPETASVPRQIGGDRLPRSPGAAFTCRRAPPPARGGGATTRSESPSAGIGYPWSA